MPKITMTAKLSAAEGKADECREAIKAAIAASDEENGLLVYSCSEDSKNPGTFVFFEVYEDQAALDVHGKGDAMKSAMGALGGLLSGRPEITMMSPVAAKGLDFS